MPQYLKNGFVALALFVLIGFSAVLYVGYGFAYLSGQQSIVLRHAVDGKEEFEILQRSRECLIQVTTIQDARECVDAAGLSVGGDVRAVRDLAAQENMATSAKGTLLVTAILGLLSVVISSISVIAIYQTLHATQTMTSLTDQFGRMQTEAYMNLGQVWYPPLEIGMEQRIDLSLGAKNSGQSTARMVSASLCADIFVDGASIAQTHPVVAFENLYIEAGGYALAKTYFPAGFFTDFSNRPSVKLKNTWRLRYETRFKQEYELTCEDVLDVAFERGEVKFSRDQGEYPAATVQSVS